MQTNCNLKAGFNLAGYLRTESGVGAAGRAYMRALHATGLPLSLVDVSDVQGNRSEDGTLQKFDTEYPYDMNVVCADVQAHFAILTRLGESFFKGRYNIAIWAWEQLHFPHKWYNHFAYYDEIWVNSSFIANVLAPAAPIPVVRIPPVLTLSQPGCRDTGRRRLGVARGEFVFLFIFDFHSRSERKNPLGVIRAFKKAFHPPAGARLVIKCVNPHSAAEEFACMKREAEGFPIVIHAGYWPAQDVRDLLAACDAYVSLHRAEGFGLTISDAMAMGKPVIATGWSGNMDFMNVGNSFPVSYELVELERRAGPYQAGELWAEPSVEHAAELMRMVIKDGAETGKRAQAGQKEIEANYSESRIASLIKERLQAIALRRRFLEFQRQANEDYRGYLALPERLRDAVERSVPPGATVAVVNKGDDRFLDLKNHRAWHFPRGEDGLYLGYYPADSAAAIEHLEAQRRLGADYLLFPQTGFWWLDHYDELRQHLEARCRRVHADEHCWLYQLPTQSG